MLYMKLNKSKYFIHVYDTFLCLVYLQVAVEAPWLSDLGANCVVVGQGVLVCVDVATHSLYTLDLHLESQTTQIPLQVPA